MDKLDLHGKKHREVARLVEDFLLMLDGPGEIVTGNSSYMKTIVSEICDHYGFDCYYPNDYNLGSFIVVEKR